ncbi:hypothetical protein C8A03DRAFT_17718 [Achaetomium macrosporum]|uniref:Uncharacterized protein n=1 Tax=Achaetomium macrosporum TaxID=79813 RepID=A0AAN7C557_9PEZI|nr:hypothetical protein C8A03DRAFT_17718 [Achaetomium macrosporum]
MASLYDDPFAYDGSDFTGFLGQDQFATGSSPEDFHVTSATEPHFPAATHNSLKGAHHQPQYLSPTDPLGPTLDHNAALQTHLARSAPTNFPGNHPNNTIGLAWNNTTSTTTTTTTTNTSAPQNPDEIQNLLASLHRLQSELRRTARERDEARLQLSTAHNELYAARQDQKRLRAERDEARSQAEFLGAERVKAKQTETRLRRERNEARARLALLLTNTSSSSSGGGGGGSNGAGVVVAAAVRGLGRSSQVVMMGGESQGEESGESPPMGALLARGQG